jgi:dipeptidyl aminopeptidase/acylaminoacyl peptidase
MKRRRDAEREHFDRASPIARVSPSAPPFLVVHGAHDTLVPVAEARRFVEALRRTSREPVVYAEIPGAQHAFEIFPSLRSAHVLAGVERWCAWLHGRYLARRSAPEAASG